MKKPRDLKLTSVQSFFLNGNAPEFEFHYESDEDPFVEWIWLQYKKGEFRVRFKLISGRLCLDASMLSLHADSAKALHNQLTIEYMKGSRASDCMNIYGRVDDERQIAFVNKRNFGDDFNEENLWQFIKVALQELVDLRCRLDVLEGKRI